MGGWVVCKIPAREENFLPIKSICELDQVIGIKRWTYKDYGDAQVF